MGTIVPEPTDTARQVPRSAIRDPKCGKWWTGLRAEHCTSCHESFSGTTAGDKHRIGPGDRRRCLHPRAIGLVYDDKRRVWHLPSTDSRWTS